MAIGFGPTPPSVPVGQASGMAPAVDAELIQAQWLSSFSELDDPRGRQGVEHSFLSIVMIAVLATIAGANGWDDIELYAESHQTFLGSFLDLRSGIPHADTYRRVFARMDPEQVQQCFLGWVNQIVEATGAQVISMDGKTVRGSYDRNKKQSALHLVSAWSSEHRLMLGQVKVKNKSNEITAIPALLELLDLTGCIITIDAMGTQTEIARKIVDKQADYVLCLKSNHPKLFQDVQSWFEQAQNLNFQGIEHSHEHQVEGGHHRIEKRQIWAVPVSLMGPLHQVAQWAGLNTVIMVIRVRHLWNKTTREVMFYLSSLPCNAQLIARAIRQHWGIENQLHWVLDVTFGEDDCRIRDGHGSENFGLLRRLAINLLNRETSTKRSLSQKTKRAAMNPNYMLLVLAGAVPI